jgi:CheY-like chemotaxis protein
LTAVVQADRTRLKQVLLNLLSNAVKYNRDGGVVTVECAHAGAQRLRLSVRDTGMGLGSEQLASLFQPFNRLGQEGGTQEGTGIGLVVTRRLVELMGGAIGVASSPGAGSTFWIELATAEPTLPVTAPPPAPGGPDDADAPAAGPHLIVYIEDNPANLKLVQEIVGYRRDLRLLAAPDGQAGLALARSERPELVLTDLNLPGMSGIEVLAELRHDPATAAIPVIALTANAMPRDIERGLAAGFARYLTKPIDIEQFNEAIDGALAQRAAAERTAP